MLQVLEEHLRTDVLDRAVRLDADSDLAVAELIAEQERHATSHAGAERSAGRHAERRLADGVEREDGLVRRVRELLARRKSRRRILQVVGDCGAARRIARGQALRASATLTPSTSGSPCVRVESSA